LWAERNTHTETLARAERLKDKVSAVTSFFDFAGKHPGDVTPEDVSRWRAEMERRGLKPATVYARVSRVSAFYRWLMSDPQLSRFIRTNPAAQSRPRYPKPYQSVSTKALTDEEMNSLLDVVRRLAGSGSVVGKRDYALLLFYFLTGPEAQRGHRTSGEGPGVQRRHTYNQVPTQGREVHREGSLRPGRLRRAERLPGGGR
jgi:site-specific recombinase XerC